MKDFYTIPSQEILRKRTDETPMWMYPCEQPSVVVQEGALTKEQCEEIIRDFSLIDPYNFPGCEAGETTEGHRPWSRTASLKPIHDFGLWANQYYFNFQLNKEVCTWMQTYRQGNSYQMHMDASPGQSRKLSVIALLSDEKCYAGGTLEFFFPPNKYGVSSIQGSLITFPAWQMHEVQPVTAGKRQTINMGFYGPPFR